MSVVDLLPMFKFGVPSLLIIIGYALLFRNRLGISLNTSLLVDIILYIVATLILGAFIQLLFFPFAFFIGEPIQYLAFTLAAITLAPIFYHFIKKTPKK